MVAQSATYCLLGLGGLDPFTSPARNNCKYIVRTKMILYQRVRNFPLLVLPRLQRTRRPIKKQRPAKFRPRTNLHGEVHQPDRSPSFNTHTEKAKGIIGNKTSILLFRSPKVGRQRSGLAAYTRSPRPPSFPLDFTTCLTRGIQVRTKSLKLRRVTRLSKVDPRPARRNSICLWLLGWPSRYSCQHHVRSFVPLEEALDECCSFARIGELRYV